MAHWGSGESICAQDGEAAESESDPRAPILGQICTSLLHLDYLPDSSGRLLKSDRTNVRPSSKSHWNVLQHTSHEDFPQLPHTSRNKRHRGPSVLIHIVV